MQLWCRRKSPNFRSRGRLSWKPVLVRSRINRLDVIAFFSMRRVEVIISEVFQSVIYLFQGTLNHV